MKKKYLLLFCLSFLCSHKIWADVGSIQIRLNENMQVVDLATSSVSTSTIDEVFVQQGGLTTAEEGTCTFNQDDTVQEAECTCPDGGTLTQHGNKYVCCQDKKIYKEGAYSSYFMPTCGCPEEYDKKQDTDGVNFCCKDGYACLAVNGNYECTETAMQMPFCGCPSGEYPRKEDGTSINEDDNLPFCCNMDGAYISAKRNDGRLGKVSMEDKNEDFTCSACPTDSIILNDNFCCNAEGKIYQGDRWSDDISAECYCAMEDKTNCTSQDTCTNTPGMKWCEASGVCIEGEKCPCVPGVPVDDENACDKDSCSTQGGCWINDRCEEEDPEKSCAQRQCEDKGDEWCVTGDTGICKPQCCVPGDDENEYCTQDTCRNNKGCWLNGICKAVQSCPDKQTWDENTCSCAVPVSCPEGKKPTEEGYCIPCPAEGTVKGEAGDYVCCNDETKKLYIKNEGVWSTSPEPDYAKCGCKEGLYLKGELCVSCTMDTHCSDEGKVCDPESNTCVECTDTKKAKCTGGKECNAENICACPEGTNWNESTSSCVECDGNYQNSNAKWPCSTIDEPICSNGVCEACPQDKQNWNNGKCVECTENDPCSDGVCQTETNTCVQCLTDDNCSDNPNKHCVNNQCVQCTKDEHCDTGSCVGNECVACTTGKDCQAGEWCDLENGLCVAGCNTTMVQDETNNTCQCDKSKDSEDPSKDSKTPIWDAWRNRCVSCFRAHETTPVWNGTECVACPADKPVWDLYNEKCVPCYDSISANWTDLGCGGTVNHSDYNPRQSQGPNAAERVCKVDAEDTDNNHCVQCAEDSHCPTNKKCKNNECVECDGSYGKDVDLPCRSDKPLCSNGVCKACETAYPTKPNWNGTECVACTKHYGVAGDGYECPSSAPYCDDGTCKKCENVGTKTKKQFGMSKNGTIGCYLCINDKTDNSTASDRGCPDNYPICPTTSGKGYNVCCPANKPIWKNGQCAACPEGKRWDGNISCVECTTHNHCGAGKYCSNSGSCVNCAVRTRCGCTDMAQGDGTCITSGETAPTTICPHPSHDRIWREYGCTTPGKLCGNHNSQENTTNCDDNYSVITGTHDGENRTP